MAIQGLGDTGILSTITDIYQGIKTNIQQVVIPYWSDKAKSAIASTVTKISDLTGWLKEADNNIAQADIIYDKLKSMNKVTSKDTDVFNEIKKKQIDLAKRLQSIGTEIQTGKTSGSDYSVTISSNPAETSSSTTFNVTTSLLPSTYGTSGLGLIPAIAITVAGVGITGVIVYEIYKIKQDSKQYLVYMKAREEAVEKGLPLPPLPPALASYQKSSWSTWLLAGIGVAIVGGYFIRRYGIQHNPYATSKYYHEDIEPISHFQPDTIRTITRGKYKIRIGRPKKQYKGHTGIRGGATRAISKLIPIENPTPVEVFTNFHHFLPEKVKDVYVPDNYPDDLIKLGIVQSIIYKSNKFDKKYRYYEHKFKHPTILATDTEGKGLYLMNPKITIKPEGIGG